MSAIVTQNRSEVAKPSIPRVRGKLRLAIERAITEGLYWPDAARAVGLSPRAVRAALNKPHVQNFIRERKAEFRLELSTRNEFRLGEIRDQNDNRMAAVVAIKTLENLDRDERERPQIQRHVTPGVVVVINKEREPLPIEHRQRIILVNPEPHEDG